MKRTYTKDHFKNLDFDSKCVIFESIPTDDYFNRLREIGLCFPDYPNIKPGKALAENPAEIKKIEDEKMALLIQKLTEKLLSDRYSIDFDLNK